MSGLKRWLALLTAAFILGGCSGNGPAQPPSADTLSGTEGPGAPTASEPSSQMTVVDAAGDMKEIVPGSVYTGEIEINTPEASGTVTYEKNGVTIDASHTADGYIMVKCEGATARLKVVVKLGDEKYQYDLNQEGKYEVFPLQMGNGTYEIGVYQHVKDTTYSPLHSASLEVEMPDTDRVFVFPSQYIWYTNEESAAMLSYDLCVGLTGEREKAEKIYDYVVGLLSYDYEVAEKVKEGSITTYLPDLEEVIKNKKGICFDYSALYAAMLRAQDIPVRLVIGYVQPENLYHAWNQVYVDGQWVWKDATFGPETTHTAKDYTGEREY